MIKALIFDVDGTLADTERDGHRVAFNQAFKEAGFDWHWYVALYGELLTVTGGKERINYYVAKYHPELKVDVDFAVKVAMLHRDKTRLYTELLSAAISNINNLKFSFMELHCITCINSEVTPKKYILNRKLFRI